MDHRCDLMITAAQGQDQHVIIMISISPDSQSLSYNRTRAGKLLYLSCLLRPTSAQFVETGLLSVCTGSAKLLALQ